MTEAAAEAGRELAAWFKGNRKSLAYIGAGVRCPRCRKDPPLIAAVVWHQGVKVLWIVGGRNAHDAERLGRAEVANRGARQRAEAARRSMEAIRDQNDGRLPPGVEETTQAFEADARVVRPEPSTQPGVAGPMPSDPNETLTFAAVPCPRCHRPVGLIATSTGVFLSP
jgi:hypothetical protein